MKIAILGFGTVGRGAYEAAKFYDGIEVAAILSRHELPEYGETVTADITKIINNPEIDLVAECMGGTTPAFEYVTAAMKAGKHVVTPNKNLVSAHFEELMKCAEDNGVEFRFTPTAGGGIPWLVNLMRAKRCDRIAEVQGIVNGTCNYILDNMHTNGADFDDVLKKAQELGYAEADPTADIGGFDTLRKCVISANIAFDADISEEDIPCFGIDGISAGDIDRFSESGYVCRLLMNAVEKDGKISAYVEPSLLSLDELEAGVHMNYNLISLTGVNCGPMSFYGQGAGKMPTGTSLVHDMIDIKEGVSFASNGKKKKVIPDNNSVKHRYYMRLESDSLELPADIIEEKGSFGKEQYAFTKPISVKLAHETAVHFKGEKFFMAGIRE